MESYSANNSIYQHSLALEGIQVICIESVGTFISLRKVNTIACICAAASALSRTASR